jgi:type I restriction enzyme S subunit
MKHIKRSALRDFTAPIPPLPEQKRIAGVLGGVDAAIEATKAVITQTKKLKQGLLQTLLTRGINHTKFKPSPLGQIPEGWETLSGEKLFKLGGGHSPSDITFSDDGDCLFIKVEDMNHPENKNFIVRSSLKFHRNEQKKNLNIYPAGTVVFAKRGAAISKNRVRILSFPGTVDPNMMCLQSQKLLAPYIQEYLAYLGLDNIADTTSVPQINNKHLYPLLFPLPPLHEQKAIAEIFESVDNQLTAETTKLTSLQQLKKGLMHDLLTGKVRVAIEQSAVKATSNALKNPSPQKAVQPAFKRAVLAAEITHQLHQNQKFGAVKLEKIIDLCERHLDLDGELDRTAYRQAAGPYDNKAKRSIEANLKSHKWFDVQRPIGAGVKYLPLENCGQHKQYFDRYFGHITADIQFIINILRDMDTERCEIVATLYAAWNDFLLTGKTPDDEAIVSDVLTNWHDKKQNIAKDRWLNALPWMRQKNLVPHGSGRKTRNITSTSSLR